MELDINPHKFLDYETFYRKTNAALTRLSSDFSILYTNNLEELIRIQNILNIDWIDEPKIEVEATLSLSRSPKASLVGLAGGRISRLEIINKSVPSNEELFIYKSEDEGKDSTPDGISVNKLDGGSSQAYHNARCMYHYIIEAFSF